MEVEYPTWVMAVEVSVATTVVFRVQPSLGPWAEASNTGRRRSTRYTSILRHLQHKEGLDNDKSINITTGQIQRMAPWSSLGPGSGPGLARSLY